MKAELSFLLGFASCLILENSIESFSSRGYTDDIVGKSDLSVHLTTGKNLFWLAAESLGVIVRYGWCHSKATDNLQEM